MLRCNEAFSAPVARADTAVVRITSFLRYGRTITPVAGSFCP